MQREPVCADKWRGKEIVYLRHFPHTSTKTSLHAHFKCKSFLKIFHHVDLPVLPDYLMFAQDDRAEKCTRMPEARVELL